MVVDLNWNVACKFGLKKASSLMHFMASQRALPMYKGDCITLKSNILQLI